MKKKISFILAVLMSVSILSSCSTVDDNKETLPSVETITQADTLTTPTETEIDAESVTEGTTVQPPFVPEDTTTEEGTTVPATTEENTTTTTTQQTTANAETESKWTETTSEKKMYVTETCYSRAEAIVGSKSVATYTAGKAVNVVAVTNTGYYKLDDGSFIHSDYLTAKVVSTTTVPTTTKSNSTTTSKPTGNVSSSYNVDYTTRYAYKQLSSTKQKLYGRLVEGISNLDQMVEVPSGLSKEDIIEVYCLVFNQEPQLFWMSSSVPSGSAYLLLSYKVDDPDKIASMQAQIDKNTKSIMSKVNSSSGTFAKLKVMFDWIVKDAEFSKEAGGYNSTIYNGLGSGGDLQCAGYAKSMQYLCDLAGIPCMVIVGTNSEGASHAWNVVYCDNGYYNLDATWADPVNSFDSNYIQYEFFLVPDSWIHNKTHFNVNKKIDGTKVTFFTPPSCTQTSNNYYQVYSKVYSSEDSAVKAFKAELDKAIASGSNVATIRVSSSDLYDTLMSDTYAKTFNSYAKGKSSNVKGLAKQGKISFGTQVIHYNIVYNS